MHGERRCISKEMRGGRVPKDPDERVRLPQYLQVKKPSFIISLLFGVRYHENHLIFSRLLHKQESEACNMSRVSHTITRSLFTLFKSRGYEPFDQREVMHVW